MFLSCLECFGEEALLAEQGGQGGASGHRVLHHILPVMASVGLSPSYLVMLVHIGTAVTSLVPSYRVFQMCRHTGPCPCPSQMYGKPSIAAKTHDSWRIFGLSWVHLHLHHGHRRPWDAGISLEFTQKGATAASLLSPPTPQVTLVCLAW